MNKIAGRNGVGRIDIVENRFVGMKSRGVYEAPGMTALYAAHLAIEQLTLDRDTVHLRDRLAPEVAEMVYYGFWYVPKMDALMAFSREVQQAVNGEVTLGLLQGQRLGPRPHEPEQPVRRGRRQHGRRRQLRSDGCGRVFADPGVAESRVLRATRVGLRASIEYVECRNASMYIRENPVLQRELLTNLRMTRAFVLLFVYVALLGGVVYLAWPQQQRLDMAQPEAAKRLVNLFFFGQYMLASLMAPSFAAGAITGEKERMSYEMLLASPLRPGAIVLGKLFAALCHLGILMICSLPIVMLCLPLGGVSLYEVFAAYLAMICDGGPVRHDQPVGEQLFQAHERVARGVVPDDPAAGDGLRADVEPAGAARRSCGCWS